MIELWIWRSRLFQNTAAMLGTRFGTRLAQGQGRVGAQLAYLGFRISVLEGW